MGREDDFGMYEKFSVRLSLLPPSVSSYTPSWSGHAIDNTEGTVGSLSVLRVVGTGAGIDAETVGSAMAEEGEEVLGSAGTKGERERQARVEEGEDREDCIPLPSPPSALLSTARRTWTCPPTPSLPPSLSTPCVLLCVFLLLGTPSIMRVFADVFVSLQLVCKTFCVGRIIRAGYAGSTGLAVDCLKCGNTPSVTIPSDMCSITAFCWGDLWASAGLIFT